MAAHAELSRKFAIIFASPDDLAQVREYFDRIEPSRESGDLTDEEAYDLKAYAFRAMRKVTEDDQVGARELILGSLLPHCLLFPEATAEIRYSIHRYRRELATWIERLGEPGRTIIRAEILSHLCSLLEQPCPGPACWTIEAIGYWDRSVLDSLWGLVERDGSTSEADAGEDSRDHALGVLSSLGPPSPDRERLLAAICQRAKSTSGGMLVNAMRRMAEPAFLDVIGEAWIKPDREWWPKIASSIIRIPGDIAAAHPGLPDVQDRAWDLTIAIFRADPKRLKNDLYLGGDVAPKVDSPRVIPDLFRILMRGEFGVEDNEHLRYLTYVRAGECCRPRQLEGWSDAIDAAILNSIRADAFRDTKSPGIYRTIAMDVKKLAWETLLATGDATLPTAASFEAALAEESNPNTCRRVCEALACFRLDPPPPTAIRWVAEQVDVSRDDMLKGLLHRSSATKVLQGSATREAFDALLRFGFTLDGSALLSSLDAVAEVALWRAMSGDVTVCEVVAAVADRGEHRNQRVASAEVILHLAMNRLIPPPHYAFLPAALEDPGRDDSEMSRLVEAIGFLPGDALSPALEARLAGWCLGDGRLAVASLATLARQRKLLDYPDLLGNVLGLARSGDRWGVSPSDTKVGRYSGVLGLLYAAHPAEFQDAVCDVLKTKDWVASASLIVHLDGLFGAASRHPIPAAILDAMVERVRRRQTRTGAETELFQLLARWSPGALARVAWAEAWSNWLPDARVALANALGEGHLSDEDTRRALSHARALTADGMYAVRRSSYRTMARRSPERLREFCEMASIGAESRPHDVPPAVEVRRRGAEAVAWLDDEATFTAFHGRFASDPEPSVREVAARMLGERTRRVHAGLYSPAVMQVVAGDTREVLSSWRYGLALAETGDDETLSALREHVVMTSLPPNVRHWIEATIERLEPRWRKVTEGWPEPWIPIEGSIQEGAGTLILGGNEIPVRYSLWKRPAKTTSMASSWGGIAWADDASSFFFHVPEVAILVLDEGQQVKIQTTSSSGGQFRFSGVGPDPS